MTPCVAVVDLRENPDVTVRSRQYSFPGRDHGVHPRFTAGEYAELMEAAARAGLTPTGYVGEAALASARGLDQDGYADAGGITRAELAQLQRDLFAARTALNQAAAGLRQATTGANAGEAIASCTRSVAGVDAVVDRIHRQLRQAASPIGDAAS
jgi:hypothetical protein